MDREEITARLLDTLRDEHGAGSDLDVGTYGDPWLEVNGNLDIEHLTSDIEQMIVEATSELQKRIDDLELDAQGDGK